MRRLKEFFSLIWYDLKPVVLALIMSFGIFIVVISLLKITFMFKLSGWIMIIGLLVLLFKMIYDAIVDTVKYIIKIWENSK